MTVPKEDFEAPVGFWERLKRVVKSHPKGRPYDEKGQFYPDPTPVAPPVGFSHVADIDMFEVMKQRIRNEMSIYAQMQGSESFEEADDFEVEEDFEPFSPYELITEQFVPDGPIVNPDPDQKPTPAAPKATEPAVAEGGEGGGSPKNPPSKPPAKSGS